MFLLWWIGCAYMAGGAAVPCTVINSSIHVLMYRQVTHNMIYVHDLEREVIQQHLSRFL